MWQSGSLATWQDIYNQITNVCWDVYKGQSSIHALVNQLNTEEFWSQVQFSSDEWVTAVLFAHSDSLVYLQAYSEILLLDCTYKINKYDMSLLDMIGIDACQWFFCIAFAFLSDEIKTDYTWALDQLKSLYKQCDTSLSSIILTDCCLACINAASTLFSSSTMLICIWHANKTVLTWYQSAFLEAEKWKEFYEFWFSIVNSSTEKEYNNHLLHFEQEYCSENLDEVGYIKVTWLISFKEKLIKTWIDQSIHFKNTVISCIEEIHALLKSYLRQSTFDLFNIWKTIQLALLNQLSELQSNQARQQLQISLKLSSNLYEAVWNWISHEVLQKIEEQWKLLFKKDQLACTDVFSWVYELSCLHILNTIQGTLLLNHFYSHWHLKHDEASQLFLESCQCIESKSV